MDRAAFETARLELARLRLDHGRGIATALDHAARVCARALRVERVGIWLFDDAFERLTCAANYTLTDDTSSGGDALDTRTFPTYRAALRQRRAIVADDAQHDPATAELTETYLAPLGITAMLDAPLYRSGDVVGVVCLEHVGAPRRWTQQEIDFASSVADIVSIVFEQRDRLVLEEELQRRAARNHDADRLQALSRVCGAVAHDFQNVLTMVSMVAARVERLGSPEAVELARALDTGVGVGTRLIGQIHSFGTRPTTSHGRDKVADVPDVVTHVQPVIDLLVRDVAELRIAIATPDAIAAIPRRHLEQIVLNLCLNARDAIDQAGHIEVRVAARGDRVILEVQDDGVGIPVEVLEHIFDPYFTTKATGTGLGLATVRDIVTEHGGAIAVTSEVGRGTTFTLDLPRAS
jgi:signal transduction histidine kinase